MVMDALGPGLFGFSLVLEALMAVFVAHFYWPDFPYLRLLEKGALIILVILFFAFLGPDYGARMLEALWQFILRNLVSALPL